MTEHTRTCIADALNSALAHLQPAACECWQCHATFFATAAQLGCTATLWHVTKGLHCDIHIGWVHPRGWISAALQQHGTRV